MLSKAYTKTRRFCRVTFRIRVDKQVGSRGVALLADFNEWNAQKHPMRRRKDGAYSATVSLAAGRTYRFRYLVDGRWWITDEGADRMMRNQYGSLDGLLDL